MRTDSVSLAKEAVAEIRDYISSNFAADYLPRTQPAYKSKTKNAQESHEAIRPTSIARTPDSIRSHLSVDQARLYEMIWKRTLACQMAPARFDTVSLDIRLGGDTTLFRATGQTLVFPGFIGVYMEDVDDANEEEGGKLPPLQRAMCCRWINSMANNISPSRRRAFPKPAWSSHWKNTASVVLYLRHHYFHAASP